MWLFLVIIIQNMPPLSVCFMFYSTARKGNAWCLFAPFQLSWFCCSSLTLSCHLKIVCRRFRKHIRLTCYPELHGWQETDTTVYTESPKLDNEQLKERERKDCLLGWVASWRISWTSCSNCMMQSCRYWPKSLKNVFKTLLNVCH